MAQEKDRSREITKEQRGPVGAEQPWSQPELERQRYGAFYGRALQRLRQRGPSPSERWGSTGYGGSYGGPSEIGYKGGSSSAFAFEERGRRPGWQREALTAREVMTRTVKTATRQTSLKDIAQIMKDENVGIVPIVDEHRRLIGVVTDRDLITRTLPENRNPMDLKAEDVMTDDIEAATQDEPLREVIDLLAQRRVRRVPVVDRDDRLLGIISVSDIASKADYDVELQDVLARLASRRSFWDRLWS